MIIGFSFLFSCISISVVVSESVSVDVEDEDDDTINYTALESELHAALEEDAKYWRENDAKFRAVEQRVATFDEFRLSGGLHVHKHVANMQYSFTIRTL
jgi:hypothetical protein